MERKRSVICSLWNMKRLAKERGRAIKICHEANITTEISFFPLPLLVPIDIWTSHRKLWKALHNCMHHCMLRFSTSTQSFAILLSVLMVNYRYLTWGCTKAFTCSRVMNQIPTFNNMFCQERDCCSFMDPYYHKLRAKYQITTPVNHSEHMVKNGKLHTYC